MAIKIETPRASALTASLRCFFLFGCSLTAGMPPWVYAQDRDHYELRGKIIQEDRKGGRQALPLVFIHGSVTPYTARTVADHDGSFKFKELRPGTYTLVVAVPRQGEKQQTIDVGPSLADSKGRIDVIIEFERRLPAEESRAVAATQLSVPDRARREYAKAQERLGQHDVQGAIQYLKNALDLAPQFSAAWNNLGTIAYQSGEYENAEKHFREALRHDPDSYAPLVNLGGALLSLNQAEEALQINLQAVKERPDDALAHSQLGQSYFQVGQIDPAERHLKQAKALDVRHFSFPQLVLAEIYARKEDRAAVIVELEEFLRYHPDSKLVPGVSRALEEARAMINR
jgi:tetratricopeptide (TPR) repeat protein